MSSIRRPAVLAYLRGTRHPQQVKMLHEGILCRLELGIYHVVIVPLMAFLPAPLAYGIARLQGNLRYRIDRSKRKYIMEGLEGIFGDQLRLAERIQVTRDFFRLRSCEAVDVMRMAGKGKALARLVEIRGLEHIEAALAAGNGAILCGAHFGSYMSCFSLIGVQGFPITVVGRTPSRLNRNRTFIERLIYRLVIVKPQVRHWHRTNIEPRGQLESAVQAAEVLRHNEVIGILLDPPVPTANRAKAVPMDFLNGRILLLPGVTTIARLTGAPVLMTFMHRSEDWRHQILEISPPMPLEGDTITAFKRCLGVVEEAVRQNPAHWHYCGKLVLIELGLLPEEPEYSLPR
jgi:KDO2-lipid IV(A) lauroyltransferase